MRKWRQFGFTSSALLRLQIRRFSLSLSSLCFLCSENLAVAAKVRFCVCVRVWGLYSNAICSQVQMLKEQHGLILFEDTGLLEKQIGIVTE